MLNIDRVLEDECQLKAMTGLTPKAFQELLTPFSTAYGEAIQKTNTPRQRAPGAGRKSRLVTDKHKLFYILFYCKCYPTFDIAGTVFDVDRAQACRWTHRFLPILETVLGQKIVLPKRRLESMEEFTAKFGSIP